MMRTRCELWVAVQARELSEQEKVGVVKQAEDLEAQYRRCAGV